MKRIVLLLSFFILSSALAFCQNGSNSGNSISVKDLPDSLFYKNSDTTYQSYISRLQSLLKQDKGIIFYEYREYKNRNGKVNSRGIRAKHKYGNNEDYSYKIGTWEYYNNEGQLATNIDYDLKEKIVASQYLLIPKNSIIPKDTIKTYYLDSLNEKKPCLILLNKDKQTQVTDKFKKIELIDFSGKATVLLPDQLSGYWLSGLFYKSFKVEQNSKIISFFAEELSTGKATLYSYNGEQLNGESVYIFKKRLDTEYIILQQTLAKKVDVRNPNFISFADEQPYVDYLQTFLSDCSDVYLKFTNKWYSYKDITAMFTDYNKCK